MEIISLWYAFDVVQYFFQVTELSASLSEERETASHASEMLEGETMERMRLERQMQELQVCRMINDSSGVELLSKGPSRSFCHKQSGAFGQSIVNDS